MNTKSKNIFSQSFNNELNSIKNKCSSCGRCVEDCAFLKLHGTPGKIAESYFPVDPVSFNLAFNCSLCGLCTAICKKGARPDEFFLQMRIDAMGKKMISLKPYSSLITYEKIGTSERFTQYLLPEKCNTVFFPGCNLAGTRSDKIYIIYTLMKKYNPSIGIVLDCCTKPSHDLGLNEKFNIMFNQLRNNLTENGIEEVITACPNCFKIFQRYGKPLRTTSLYEFACKNLKEEIIPLRVPFDVIVHDPCSARNNSGISDSVRRLLTDTGITYSDMKHTEKNTLCCGEGGAVKMINPKLADIWNQKIKSESGDKTIITSCGGCVKSIGKNSNAAHIIDLLFEPEKNVTWKKKISYWPFTYINRIRLKRKLKNESSGKSFVRRSLT